MPLSSVRVGSRLEHTTKKRLSRFQGKFTSHRATNSPHSSRSELIEMTQETIWCSFVATILRIAATTAHANMGYVDMYALLKRTKADGKRFLSDVTLIEATD
ncbi:hypothetical protein PoB_003247500 [Plakobranchus ocellatus]|uniref:Uncharacterized protein n=1 Tax=Plakobranchus ocellatus TaxID=259542 RepID=A0AAV4AGS8_9GAST|nr:hypothetical protein PoB_003247500 [Plakobranchus ocellatus]